MSLNFSKREKIIFYFLISVLAGYVMYVALYDLFWVKLCDVKKKIEVAQQRLSEESKMVRRLSSGIQGQKAELDLFRQTESNGSVRSKMLEALQQLSTQDDVRIADMKPGALREEDSYKEFPVSVKLEGEFVQIMKFFFDAESSTYGFRIREFRFSRSYSTRSRLQCQVVLSRVFLNTAS